MVSSYHSRIQCVFFLKFCCLRSSLDLVHSSFFSPTFPHIYPRSIPFSLLSIADHHRALFRRAGDDTRHGAVPCYAVLLRYCSDRDRDAMGFPVPGCRWTQRACVSFGMGEDPDLPLQRRRPHVSLLGLRARR